MLYSAERWILISIVRLHHGMFSCIFVLWFLFIDWAQSLVLFNGSYCFKAFSGSLFDSPRSLLFPFMYIYLSNVESWRVTTFVAVSSSVFFLLACIHLILLKLTLAAVKFFYSRSSSDVPCSFKVYQELHSECI